MKGLIMIALAAVFVMSCGHKNANETVYADSMRLLALEQNRLKAVFALDSHYLSAILDTSYLEISENEIHNKSQTIAGLLHQTALKDSMATNSFQMEKAVVNVYDNTAVVVFTVQQSGSSIKPPVKNSLRLYDVWVRRGHDWKIAASQSTKIP